MPLYWLLAACAWNSILFPQISRWLTPSLLQVSAYTPSQRRLLWSSNKNKHLVVAFTTPTPVFLMLRITFWPAIICVLVNMWIMCLSLECEFLEDRHLLCFVLYCIPSTYDSSRIQQSQKVLENACIHKEQILISKHSACQLYGKDKRNCWQLHCHLGTPSSPRYVLVTRITKIKYWLYTKK